MIEEVDDTVFHFVFQLGVVVDLVAIAGVELGVDIAACCGQPVGDFVHALSVLAHRILVAADVVDRQVFRHFRGPVRSGDDVDHLAEVEERAVACGLCECIEGILGVVLLDPWIVADPLIAQLHALGAPREHPSHDQGAHVGVGAFGVSVVAELLQVVYAFLQARESPRGTTKANCIEFISIFAYVISGDEGAHAVAEHEVGQVGILFLYQLGQGMLVLHHGVDAFLTPVTPAVILHCGFAVAHMVVRGHDEARIHELDDHVQVAPGVLAESVDQLDDAVGFGGRNVDPAVNGISLVIRLECDLMKHVRTSLSKINSYTFLTILYHILNRAAKKVHLREQESYK